MLWLLPMLKARDLWGLYDTKQVGQFGPKQVGQLGPKQVGQFTPELVGQFVRNIHLIYFLCLFNQLQTKVLINSPISCFIGTGNRRLIRELADAQMKQFVRIQSKTQQRVTHTFPVS